MIRVAWRKFITAKQFKQKARTGAQITRRLTVGSVPPGGSSRTPNSHKNDERLAACLHPLGGFWKNSKNETFIQFRQFKYTH